MAREHPHVSGSSRFLSGSCHYFLTTSAINILLRLKDLHLAGRHRSHPRSHAGMVPSPTCRPPLISSAFTSPAHPSGGHSHLLVSVPLFPRLGRITSPTPVPNAGPRLFILVLRHSYGSPSSLGPTKGLWILTNAPS